MRIAFFEIHDWEVPFLRERLTGHELSFHPEKLHESDLARFQDVEIVSVFILFPAGRPGSREPAAAALRRDPLDGRRPH